MGLVVALSVRFVTIVSNSEQVFVVAQFVALIVATEEFGIVRGKFQFTAVDHLVCIFNSFLQLSIVFLESRILLGVSDSCNLSGRQRVVTPYEISAG